MLYAIVIDVCFFGCYCFFMFSNFLFVYDVLFAECLFITIVFIVCCVVFIVVGIVAFVVVKLLLMLFVMIYCGYFVFLVVQSDADDVFNAA